MKKCIIGFKGKIMLHRTHISGGSEMKKRILLAYNLTLTDGEWEVTNEGY